MHIEWLFRFITTVWYLLTNQASGGHFDKFAKDGVHRMRIPGFPVYRIRAGGKEVERIGSILEFRRSRRSMNRIGLTKLAQQLFAGGPGDIVIVGYESILEREESLPEDGILSSAG